jgi:hypothetical protein
MTVSENQELSWPSGFATNQGFFSFRVSVPRMIQWKHVSFQERMLAEQRKLGSSWNRAYYMPTQADRQATCLTP